MVSNWDFSRINNIKKSLTIFLVRLFLLKPMFNAIQYFKDFDIPNFDHKHSKNAQIGWVNIQCPFCNDHSDHLGFNLENYYFNCWNCDYHSVYDVIQALTPFENTKEILKLYDYDILLTEKIEKKLNKELVTKIKLPGFELEKIHKRYLKNRGLDPLYIEEKYKIRGTLNHKNFPFSLIIPIFQQNKLVTYQTRGTTKEDRYINCLPENEITPIKETIYNIDNCNNNFIIITEGVFKVFKLGDNSCCVFGKNFTHKQIQKFLNYDVIIGAFDPDEAGESGTKKLCNLLDSLGKQVYYMELEKPADEFNVHDIKLFWKEVYSVL